MIPVIAIVGRPNVGKSTLFNQLTKTRAALVADQPGLTRDRQYGIVETPNLGVYCVIDTGGLGEEKETIDNLMAAQTREAINEADAVFFLVDGRSGITAGDENLAGELRKLKKSVYLVVNKTDGLDSNVVLGEFYKLGLGEPFPIAAAHGRGINALMAAVETPNLGVSTTVEMSGIKIAFIGQPNVGKSTLVNRILGEERVVVCDQPGTTRDSIFIPFKRGKKEYILIDTAGIRRRAKTKATVEKFSVIKAIQAITEANVVVMVIDARKNIVEQDLRLIGMVLEAGKALVLAVNKWDDMEPFARERTKKELDRRLTFLDFAEIHFISALKGQGLAKLFPAIERAYRSAVKKLATPVLTRILQDAVTAHAPPLVGGRKIKLRYAHAGGRNPPLIVIHGAKTRNLAASYRRYLEHSFRRALHLVGTPVRIEFKEKE